MRQLALILCSFTLVLSATASADTIATLQRRFVVQYSDGTLERYVIRWTALADFAVHESGGPAEPFKGKFVDDRRCEWSSNGRIERQVFLIRRGSQLTEDPNKKRVYNTDSANQGASFSFSNFRSENCNDAKDRRESDFNNTRSHLREELPRTAASDFPSVTQEYLGASGRVLTIPAEVDASCYDGTWDEDVRGKFTWEFKVSGDALRIRRNDGFASGDFRRTDSGWTGRIQWGNGDTWSGVTLSEASLSCDEVRTNQVWYFKRY